MKFFSLLLITAFLAACGRAGAPNSGPASTSSTPVTGPQSQMGTINGGGGVGVRCGNHLEMLDLYEARMSGLTQLALPSSQDAAASLLASLIAKHFWNIETIPPVEHEKLMKKDVILPIFEGRAFHNYETDKMENVQFVETLPLSNDFGNYKLPAACQLEQIAFFSDAKTELSIVRSAWGQLDLLSKSVLVAHELLYMVNRRSGLENLRPKGSDHTSESARKFVGQLLSVESLPKKSDNFPPTDGVYRCNGGLEEKNKAPTYFYAFNNVSTGKLNLVFNGIYGASSLYQLRADFKDAVVADLIDKTKSMTDESAELQSVGSKQRTNFVVKLSKSSNSDPIFKLYFSDSGEIQVGEEQEIHCDKF
jgi:hypothetical protein